MPSSRPSPKLPNGFIKLGLAPELIAAVEDLGFTQPTTVQEQVIPRAMTASGDADGATRFVDLMVSSQTGSGKTAAFLLPVLHTLLQAPGRSRGRGQGRVPAPGRRSRRPRRSAAQEAQAQGPDQRAPLQGRHARRPDPVPDARTRAAGGARRHRPGQALPRPAHRQRGGRHALPAADRASCRTPTSWSPRRAACSTCSARCRSSSTRSSSSSSTKPTACSTWASRTTWPKSTSSPSSASRP